MEQTTLQEEKRDYAVLVGLRSPVLGDDSADEESPAVSTRADSSARLSSSALSSPSTGDRRPWA